VTASAILFLFKDHRCMPSLATFDSLPLQFLLSVSRRDRFSLTLNFQNILVLTIDRS